MFWIVYWLWYPQLNEYDRNKNSHILHQDMLHQCTSICRDKTKVPLTNETTQKKITFLYRLPRWLPVVFVVFSYKY